MRHNVLLISDDNDPGLPKVLRRAGCSVRIAADIRQAGQALRRKPVDLVYANLPQQAATFRLVNWAAKLGVPAMVIALPGSTHHTDVSGPRPAVLRFVCRAALPGVVRRIEGGNWGLLMLDARDLTRTPPTPTVINLVGLLRGRDKTLGKAVGGR